FTILMPPPNANASLHAGHGMYTIDDILIRWKRMQGYGAQWIPGRDHAGFETQFVYEKHLAKEGKSRLDFDRKTLYDNIAKFVEDNSGLIFEQFRRLGFSADWGRSVFTLDPQVLTTVLTTFKKMESEGLVYRSEYMVNYCTHCGTSLAELEVKHVEREDPLYYLKYGPFTLATVRPETKFGDTAVAVHPKDKRYKQWIGKEIEVEGLLGKFKVRVIADDVVDMEFGTGVVKVTPAHDPNDFEMGKRHNLEMKKVIDLRGKLTPIAGPYAGMSVKTARVKIAEDLEKAGLLARPTDDHYVHAVTVCYKCGRDLEPTVMPNWFVKVESLKPAVIKAVKTKETKFFPKKYEKQILDWMDIMHDWPISRQIAWGIRIPVWYRVDGNEGRISANVIVAGQQFHGPIRQLLNGASPLRGGDQVKLSMEEIKQGLQQLIVPLYEGENKVEHKVSVEEPKDGNWIQETDTFDTWFSSGQWPLVTLKENEYSMRYPSDTMATMSDILKFWVSRMMMFGLYVRGKTPFKNVYLWSTITDAKGQKMSKSKGNVINPIDLVDKYGADAFRMSLLFGNGEGGKVPLSEDKVRAMRNFGNKIWNMARFYLMMSEEKNITPLNQLTIKSLKNEQDKEIIKELNGAVKKVTTSLEKFRFAEAADTIYEFMWHTVADVYIEQIKGREDKEVALSVLREVLLTGLKLLHPFMPFVTEAIWKEINPEDGMLIVAEWPTV
ncbi:MAG: valine--tRNA ligase, partial [Microgenomates group bacterium]